MNEANSTKKIKSICVYCGSSKGAQPYFVEAAKKVGTLFAEAGIRLVFGGGQVGLMGVVADACLANQGQVLGIMTDFLDELEGGHRGITDLRIVSSMHERKMMMFEASDAFLVLPGGLGTLDETFEVLTWKQVGMHEKPIIFLDVEGYWSGLFQTFLDHMIDKGFVRAEDKKLFKLVKTPEEVLKAAEELAVPSQDFVSKWG